MANTNLLSTQTVSFNEIMGNGKIHKVPLFQCDYSWEEDNWDDLWTDLMNAHDRDEAHYMGSLVLQVEGDERDKIFWIIDGQQRLTTLNILTLAIIQSIRTLAEQNIDADKNRERANLLMSYLGQRDPASLSYSSKLFLNENNDGFYQRHLLNFRKPSVQSKLTDSEKLLWHAYQFFLRRIEETLLKQQDGALLAAFLNKTVGELLKFIQITVKDELNAYAVFETLNSRGLDLTSTDLLKNFLFMMVSKSPSDLKMVKEQWQKIVSIVGLKEFPIFLRHFINTRGVLVSKEQLFKRIKQLIQTEADVLKLLDELELYAFVYTALGTPHDDLWKEDKDLVVYITALKLFRVTVCHPLLMVVYDKFTIGDFKKILSAVVKISFRYNVIAKLQTKEMERVYNQVALSVYNEDLRTAKEVIDKLKIIYLDDEKFKQYFQLATFDTRNSYQRKMVRYILYSIESQKPNGIKADYEIDDGTIEHILPESLNEDWQAFFSEQEHAKMVYTLGNMTLLEASKNNKQAAQKLIDEKIPIYASSRYALSKEIIASEWTVKSIQHRQQNLSKTACGIWKL